MASENEVKKIFKSYRAETKSVDDKEGYIKAIVSTEAVDRDGEIILSSAWRKTIGDFMKHPVVISSHDYNDLTKQLGEWVSLEVTDNGLEGVAKYYINKGNAEADWGYELAKQGKSAYSVGFMAYDYMEGNGEDNAKRTYTDVELLEISQVTIPSNRDSLVTMRSKGLNPVAEEIAKELYPETEVQEEESKAPLPGADRYTTEEEALERAEEIGCEGTHTMEDEDGNIIYMPCATHQDYDEITNPSEEEEEEEQEENPDGYDEDKGVNFVTFTKEEKQNLMKAVDNINDLEAKQTEKIYSVADAIREGVNAGLNKIKNNNSKNKE